MVDVSAGRDRNVCGFIGHRRDYTLLNAVEINSYPGEKEPWILRQFDTRHFDGIKVFTYAAKSQSECAGNRVL